jgi:nucleoid-associated protein YgaU
MKLWYLAAILMIALLIGCANESAQTAAPEEPAAPAAPAEPAAPAVEAPPEPPAEETAPVEETPAETTQTIQADQAQIDRLKAACENGNAGLCAALKTQYGIVMQPGSNEPETTAE